MAESRSEALVAELYTSSFRRMVGLATALTDDPSIGEEIAQEAFVRLFARWNRIRDPASAEGYLRRIVVNLCRDHGRRRQIIRRRQRPDNDLAPDAADRVVLIEEHREVLDALRRLPRRQREVLVMRYFANLSERAIADTLGLSAGSVKSYAHKGIARLRETLEP